MIDTWLAELPHGITLSCRGAGARGRPLMLFLHGFPEAAFVWDELLAHFAQFGCAFRRFGWKKFQADRGMGQSHICSSFFC